VTLLKDGTELKVLHGNTGGSQHDIVQSYTLSPAEIGSPNGRYTLKVVDSSAEDVGTVNQVTLTFN
jgi:hypothetical protein